MSQKLPGNIWHNSLSIPPPPPSSSQISLSLSSLGCNSPKTRGIAQIIYQNQHISCVDICKQQGDYDPQALSYFGAMSGFLCIFLSPRQRWTTLINI